VQERIDKRILKENIKRKKAKKIKMDANDAERQKNELSKISKN
jgi:hypothetical protein